MYNSKLYMLIGNFLVARQTGFMKNLGTFPTFYGLVAKCLLQGRQR